MVDIITFFPLILVIILLILSVPIFVSLGFGIMWVLLMQPNFGIGLYAGSIYSSLAQQPLIAVPAFILVGDILAETGLAQKIYDFTESLVGGFRTSMGSVTVLSCGLFSMISGSNASDAATIGRITIDPLEENGYPRPYASALVAAGGSTGILIPPSIMYIIAGTVLNISSARLFLGALIPGILVLFGILVTNLIQNHRYGFEGQGNFKGFKNVLVSFWETRYALFLPFIILGGIYSGIFTPTESATVAVFFGLAIGLVKKLVSFGTIPTMLERSAAVNGILAPNVAVGMILGEMFAAYNVPGALLSVLTTFVTSQIEFILIITAFLVLLGMVLETAPNIIIFGPLLLPIATEFGFDPIHFTIYLVTALGIGFITPPIGINLFVISGVSGEDLADISKYIVPFTISMVLVTILIAFLPSLSLWLL